MAASDVASFDKHQTDPSQLKHEVMKDFGMDWAVQVKPGTGIKYAGGGYKVVVDSVGHGIYGKIEQAKDVLNKYVGGK